jgi:hypothetical protein
VGGYNQVQLGTTGTPVYGAYGFATTGSQKGYRNTLPLWAQWFSDAGAQTATANAVGATGANTGGYNDAMDYMPVPVGYWSCAFQIPGSNSTPANGEQPGAMSSFSMETTGSDMQKFGGQLRCPTCRCMQSSLMEMRSGNLQTSFPSYGLCYRTNCAMPSYLQVAIKGQFDSATYWYQCPEKGGSLYIPGFFGALTCPAAADFCRMEPISGLRYPEQHTPRGWIRLRLLNGCNARSLTVSTSDKRNMYVIASDGGFLAEPVSLQALPMLIHLLKVTCDM